MHESVQLITTITIIVLFYFNQFSLNRDRLALSIKQVNNI